MSEKWRIACLIALAELLTMALWFSASAVIPQLAIEWNLTGAGQSWLTMSVQLGFVAGALLSALANLPDRYPAQYVFAVCALIGAVANGCIAVFSLTFAAVQGLRFLTGLALAGVYPPGMKLMASWFDRDRGLAIGILVGALTVGSASPHLIKALGGLGTNTLIGSWEFVLLVASGLALLGGVIAGAFVRTGPLFPATSRFDWRYAGRMWGDRAVRLANLGYFGHMWELYAMWAWAPLFLISAYHAAGMGETGARMWAFSTIAVGGVGSVLAGRLADRMGRTLIAIWCIAVSGFCALITGFTFSMPAVLTAFCVVWGFAVVAESAQYSAAISELCDPRYVGTALTMQTCVGFLLTVLTIRLISSLESMMGWGGAFAVLALGPVLSLWCMARLRRLPEAVKMASGKR